MNESVKMHKYTVICLLWILINVACGTEKYQQTKNGFKTPTFFNKAKNIYNNKKVDTGSLKNSKNNILEILKQYQSGKERQIIKPEVQKADETKTEETLENVLAKRLLLEQDINSALNQWLIAKLKQVDAAEKETAQRGWGNKGIPP